MLVSSITTTEPHYSKYGTSGPTIVRLTYWETQVVHDLSIRLS
jgi:hypothetical protein